MMFFMKATKRKKKRKAAAAGVDAQDVHNGPAVLDTTTSGDSSTDLIAVTVSRPKETKLGLGIASAPGEKVLTITSIAPNSLFDNTVLKCGMAVDSINGKRYSSFEEGSTLLREVEGPLTLMCSPHPNTAIVNELIRVAKTLKYTKRKATSGNVADDVIDLCEPTADEEQEESCRI